MELYYNPEQMPAAEIKQTFVGREVMLKELLALVRRQPQGVGVQHVVLVGARGMGKTTMLLMLRFAALEGDLHQIWQTVRFPEESYAITDLADFWLATIGHLAYETGDMELAARGDALRNDYKASVDLAGAALATLRDWSSQHGKRLLLLIDNLDMVLNQINNTRENARLRDALMNDGTFMLVGGAASFFHEARAYDQPLYNFFKIWHLDALEGGQIDQLLLKRAEADKRTDFERQLKQNEARIKVLHYFTGGNPRLVLMLYRIIASSDLIDVRRGLEKLLDEVTPYYKAKIESLPPQQRKILDHIARVSARTGSGLTPTEIAAETRLPVNQVTSQLKRLSGLGYVRAANVRARSSWYSLAEPLYAIWHQMRFGRESRERMAWLVEFLKAWYSSREMLDETERLAVRFAELMRVGEKALAAETLDYRQILVDAMDARFKGSATDRLVSDYLDAGNMDRARALVRSDGLTQLRSRTLQRLTEGGLIAARQSDAEVSRRLQWVDRLRATPDPEALADVLNPGGLPVHEFPKLWFIHAVGLHRLGRNEEALEDLDMYIRLASEDADEGLLRASILFRLSRFREVVSVLTRHADELASDTTAQVLLALSAATLGDFDRAIAIGEAALPRQEDPNLRKILEVLIMSQPCGRAHVVQFTLLVSLGPLAEARTLWDEKVRAILPAAQIVRIFRSLINGKTLRFLRTLISESNLDEELLPLVVAMDYLETGDRAPLEKLSAEIRPIAEEIVAELQKKLPAVAERSTHATHA
ncbi:MAG TPA: ATP-binding protein [Bryobacteraceae bacterium]|nr:ATP-binding protein [Bryobacteraceae bacterium]